MAPALIAFLLPWAPDYATVAEDLGPNVVRLLALVIVSALAAVMLVSSKSLSRPGERDYTTAVGGYALLVMLPLIAFPARLELGMTVLAVIAIGDGAAGLIGMTYGGERLPWNPAKTRIGTLAFVAFATPAATAAYLLSSHPAVSFINAFILGSMTAVAAALAESWESEINDNIRVGVTAVSSVLLWQGLLFGWN